ncbi:MAG: stage III sporulation protein AE [Bacillota bacterium]
MLNCRISRKWITCYVPAFGPMQLALVELVLILLLLAGTRPALAAAQAPQLPDLERVGLGEMASFLDELQRQFGTGISDITLDELLHDPSKVQQFLHPGRLASWLWESVWHEVLAARGALGSIAVASILCALLEVTGLAFGEGASRVGSYACFLAIAAVCMAGFNAAFTLIRGSCEKLVAVMKALIPPLIGLVAASGAPVSAGMLHPLLVSMTYFVAFTFSDYVIPLLFLGGVLDLVSHVSGGIRLGDLSSLLRQASSFVMGCSLAGFLGVMTVQRAAAGVADSVALRAAKFMSGTFVPVVGKMISDAAELVFLSTHTLRVGAGIVGAVVLVGWAIFPLLKVFLQIAMYRLVAAVTAACGAEKVASCLNAIATSLITACVALGVVTLMFVLSLALVVSAARPF